MIHRVSAAVMLLTCAAHAQCTNLVPNGGFENFFPVWQVVSGTGTPTFPVEDVNALGASQCLELTAGSRQGVSIEQTQPITLSASSRYVITADLRADADFGFSRGNSLRVFLVDAAGTLTQIAATPSAGLGRFRLSAVVSAGTLPADGDYRVRLAYIRGSFTGGGVSSSTMSHCAKTRGPCLASRR